MKIGLVSYEFRNNDIPFNLSQIEKAMADAQGKADLLCFGESFLQGFDALSWDYETDKGIAISKDCAVMEQLCGLSQRYETGVGVGYIERDGECLYSSYAVIEAGRLIHNYRRISKGWKEYRITDEHYREGTDISAFLYHGQRVSIALCGDLWDAPEQFRTDGVLLWPVYVDYTPEEWEQEEGAYAAQSCLAACHVLMINSISRNPRCYGGAFYFIKGKVAEKLPFDAQSILFCDYATE